MRRELSTFVAFLLFALMLFKVSSFHVYSHQDNTPDDIENCKVCELAIENTGSDFTFTELQIIEAPFQEINSHIQIKDYNAAVTSSFLCFNFFGRPPPNMG